MVDVDIVFKDGSEMDKWLNTIGEKLDENQKAELRRKLSAAMDPQTLKQKELDEQVDRLMDLSK